jgi:hydroxymethylpyrimidine/phosphomethylpyrimidine kinase
MVPPRSGVAALFSGQSWGGAVYYREMPPKVVLSIAGYDPSSGAGVTADVKTAAAHGCYAVTCITGSTVQSTVGVRSVQPFEPAWITATLEALWEDTPAEAVRIGMIASAGVGRALADWLSSVGPPNVVLDPILWSSSGADLCGGEAGIDVVRELMRLADVVTPNIQEAEKLAGMAIAETGAVETVGRALQKMGAKAVVVTGGDSPDNTDSLLLPDGSFHPISGQRIETSDTHGTGCAFATALACNLAKGVDLLEAVSRAKRYVAAAILQAPGIGTGRGPLNHFPENF